MRNYFFVFPVLSAHRMNISISSGMIVLCIVYIFDNHSRYIFNLFMWIHPCDIFPAILSILNAVKKEFIFIVYVVSICCATICKHACFKLNEQKRDSFEYLCIVYTIQKLICNEFIRKASSFNLFNNGSNWWFARSSEWQNVKFKM